MASLDSDIVVLEEAVRGFIKIMKRPQHWAQVAERSGVDLDRPSAAILHTLIAHEPQRLRIQDVAVQLGIEPPSVTRKTQILEEMGYLRRATNDADRRATSLEVTAAGRKLSDKLMKAHHQIMSDALATWPDTDRHQFVTLFNRFSSDLAVVSKHQPTTKKKG
jgi:DNA-binding MarR family transcriptional regulator